MPQAALTIYSCNALRRTACKFSKMLCRGFSIVVAFTLTSVVMQLGIFGPEVGGEDLAAKIDSATLSYSLHNHSKQRLSVHDFDVSRQLGLSSSANEAAQGCVRFVQVVLAIVACVHVRLRFIHERGSNTTARRLPV